MSVVRCEKCGRYIDTDFEDVEPQIGPETLCDHCIADKDDAMNKWQSIETAPMDGETIWLAHFPRGSALPLWIAQAMYVMATPSFTHCASYSGWSPDLPFVVDPTKRNGRSESPAGILCPKASRPTHWCQPTPLSDSAIPGVWP